MCIQRGTVICDSILKYKLKVGLDFGCAKTHCSWKKRLYIAIVLR